jgi:hypothetical protein
MEIFNSFLVAAGGRQHRRQHHEENVLHAKIEAYKQYRRLR